MPARLTLVNVATPDPLVVVLPMLVPLSVKLTVLPFMPEVPSVNVADRFVVPPKVPLAALVIRLVEVGVTLLKQIVTSFNVGVAALFDVLRRALYLR